MIKELKPYIVKLDEDFNKILIDNISNYGAETYFDMLLNYLDCTKIVNGLRLHQTIGVTYKLDITRAYIVATEYLKEDSNKYISLLLDVHNKNLEFEKDNPPIIYKSKKVKEKKEQKEKKEKKEKLKLTKEDKAKISLATKAKTFSTLKFTFKPASNGNNNTI